MPVLEVFRWTDVEHQTFLYITLVDGVTLSERWAGMNENEREAVCLELNYMAKAWRALRQGENHPSIGKWDTLP